MGAGRKKQTYTLKEKSQPSWTVNCSMTARNLSKKDLGGVVFGCKHNTIKECYDKLLFGLPDPHYAYVKNIDPGLPLFLFNYSDQKLHGVFEAASCGQLNINPYGWTGDDLDYTAYAAQVRVQIRMQCKPLLEDQFRPIITDNYYEPRLFWFELDHGQTRKLISLFSPSLSTQSTCPLKNTEKWNTLFRAPCTPSAQQEGNFPDTQMILNCRNSYSSVVTRASNSLPEMKWVNLFKTSSSDAKCDVENFDTPTSKVNLPYLGYSVTETATHEEATWDDDLVCVKPNSELLYSSVVAETNTSFPLIPLYKLSINNYTTQEGEFSKIETAEVNSPYSKNCNTEWSSLCAIPCSSGESQTPEAPTCEDTTEIRKGRQEVRQEDVNDSDIESVDICFSEMKSSGLKSVLAKLLLEVEELKSSHVNQFRKINCLEEELGQSRIEIQRLQDHFKKFDVQPFPVVGHVEGLEFESINDIIPLNIDELVLVVGGFDGSSWLSALDSFSPRLDSIKSLSPMSCRRSHAAVAKLNGVLYMMGGVDGNMCYETVESYHRGMNHWVGCPSLNQRKRSLAGVSLQNKIFAIGGGNEVDCFSDVEMLDLDVGRWIPTRSMLNKRFSPAAAEINGILYVVGGYDGNNYMNSMERFDPREHSWTRLKCMTTKKGCHSLAVLNEKLYALGGYDGAAMVPTVEVFEPRVGSWTMVESMNDCRGYFGAVVIRDGIYVIGGLNDRMEVLDTIEYYKEGQGWQVTNLKAIGQRSFFSTMVF